MKQLDSEFCLINEGKCMNLQGLSDKQINEIGLSFWAKANKSNGTVDTDHFIRQGMLCQKELERRAKWRKMK